MKVGLYTMFDNAVQAFMPLFPARSRGEAVRSFTDAVNRPDAQFHTHAGDFSLFFVGEFDDNSGELVSASRGPERVIGALEVLVKDPPAASPRH